MQTVIPLVSPPRNRELWKSGKQASCPRDEQSPSLYNCTSPHPEEHCSTGESQQNCQHSGLTTTAAAAIRATYWSLTAAQHHANCSKHILLSKLSNLRSGHWWKGHYGVGIDGKDTSSSISKWRTRNKKDWDGFSNSDSRGVMESDLAWAYNNMT